MSKIQLVTDKGVLSLPLKEVILKIWFGLTYPLLIGAGFALFGWRGALYAALALILTNRGKV